MPAPYVRVGFGSGLHTDVTGVFVRLKLSLLRNGLRQLGGRRAAYVASAVVVLLVAVLALAGP